MSLVVFNSPYIMRNFEIILATIIVIKHVLQITSYNIEAFGMLKIS